MSFAKCAASSFTPVSVQKNAPESSGVYGVSNSKEWLLVGEGDNIRELLLAHLKEMGTALSAQNPTGFTFELCSGSDRIARQAALIRELKPRCNRSNEMIDSPRRFRGRAA
jgi:hypothetical protein